MTWFALWKSALRWKAAGGGGVRQASSTLDCPACREGVMLPSAVGDFCNKCEHCNYTVAAAQGSGSRICPCSYCDDPVPNAA